MFWTPCAAIHIVLETHKKELCSLGSGLFFTNSEYSILVTWFLFQVVE